MCLYVLTKFNFTMRVVIQFAAKDNFRWALGFGYATFDSEHIAPKNSIVYHFNYEYGRNVFEWEQRVVAADTLFYGSVESFNFRNMFITSGDIEKCS